MKKIALLSLFSVLFALTPTSIFGQDYHFSQFRETPILVNPGLTALNHDIRVILNYKDQWRSIGTPYKTIGFSGEFKIAQQQNRDGNYLGIGFQLVNEKAGDSRMASTTGLLALNGVVKVDKMNKISLGLCGGFAQRSMDPSALTWGSQYNGSAYDPSLGSGEYYSSPNYGFVDLGTGITWSYGKGDRYIRSNDGFKANVGIAAYHFGIGKYSFMDDITEKLNTKFVGMANFEIGVENSNLVLKPEILYQRQGKLQEIVVGSMFKYIKNEGSKYTGNIKASSYSFGVHYRVLDAAIFTAMYEFSYYSIGVSYDLNISKLTNASQSRGGLEFSLRFVTPSQFIRSRARF